jgi:hypothetical protein
MLCSRSWPTSTRLSVNGLRDGTPSHHLRSFACSMAPYDPRTGSDFYVSKNECVFARQNSHIRSILSKLTRGAEDFHLDVWFSFANDSVMVL